MQKYTRDMLKNVERNLRKNIKRILFIIIFLTKYYVSATSGVFKNYFNIPKLKPHRSVFKNVMQLTSLII